MKLLPFTYPWIIRREFGNSQLVLDVGSGNGAFMKTVNFDNKYNITGIELFDPYIQKAKETGAYSQVFKQDVRKMKFKSKSFDVVHASQVIEHITMGEGRKLIENMESIAQKKVIIGTPNGHYHQEEYDGNHLQEHHSAWTVQAFKKFGYSVHGQGLKAVYGEHGIFHKTQSIPGFKYVLFIFSFVMSPLVYFFPQYAAQIIATKNV